MSRPALTLGRLVYLGYYRPIALIAQSRREGGPWQQWLTRRGRREMVAASRRLAPLAPPTADAPEIVFLSGARFWFQTAFCFWSLCRQAKRSLRLVVYDDGSFNDALATECRRLFPGAVIVSRDEIEAHLDRSLPRAEFPTLRGRRLEYPNLRKLTDVHAGRSGWRLVLDSDMLFFRRPERLLEWLDCRLAPLHMRDVHDAYGYSIDLLEKIAGARVPQHVNVGICGLRSETIDWNVLERWCRQLQDAAGTSYYQEQALTAMWLAHHAAECLPAADYRLMPDDRECRAPTAALHHYVDLSKRGYFRDAWRVALARA
jgi:hypothetical protein